MATVEEVARGLLASVSTDVGYLTALKWIDNRYKEVVSKVRFRHLRKVGEVVLPAKYDDGTVDVDRDSDSVTGTDTLWETNIGSGDQEYYAFRASSAWYNIESVDGETTITLSSTFSEDDVDDGSYSIVKRWHALDSSARWLGDFIFTRLRLNLGKPVSLDQLNREAPGRVLSGSYPVRVAQIGVDSNGYLMVEFYPYCKDSEIIHYVYWDLPSDLAATTTIPAQIDANVLREGALIDLYRYLKSKAYDEGKVDVGNSWRNDEMAQRTFWRNYLKDAARADQGADDASFILTHFGYGQPRSKDITNARDIVLDRWSWPAT